MGRGIDWRGMDHEKSIERVDPVHRGAYALGLILGASTCVDPDSASEKKLREYAATVRRILNAHDRVSKRSLGGDQT